MKKVRKGFAAPICARLLRKNVAMWEIALYYYIMDAPSRDVGTLESRRSRGGPLPTAFFTKRALGCLNKKKVQVAAVSGKREGATHGVNAERVWVWVWVWVSCLFVVSTAATEGFLGRLLSASKRHKLRLKETRSSKRWVSAARHQMPKHSP